jgi:hypothetical protein
VITDLSRTSLRALIQTPSPSRRNVLRGLAGAGLSWGALTRPGNTVAKKKRTHKKKKKQKAAEPNAFGCIDVGDLCQNAAQCCSGICEGKQGKQTCRAHDVQSCTAGTTWEACGGADVACTTGAGAPGHCFTTTGNAGYCATYAACYFCTTDVDCQLAMGSVLGPRAACVSCATCTNHRGTACASRDVNNP